MTALAPHLSAFLREHLPIHRKASEHTCDAYAYSFQLFVNFAARRLRLRPHQLEVEQLDADMMLAFLDHLEKDRANSGRTRNARLAAINAFFRYLEYSSPRHLDQVRAIRAIPVKKVDQTLVGHLSPEETRALLAAPNPRTAAGRRDAAMLHLCVAAGLRVSELVELHMADLDLRASTIRVMGKGRRERVLPLWKSTMEALRAWLAVRPQSSANELFLNREGRGMTRSGFEYIVQKHVAVAARSAPSIIGKRVSPHVLRHTCAMNTLRATRDVRKVSLWLGHADLRSTEIYLRGDPTEKLEVLNASIAPALTRGRFKAPDRLLAMLAEVRERR